MASLIWLVHCNRRWVSRVTAAGANQSRKVGTPQDRVLARARWGRPYGQCNREKPPMAGKPDQVRVKRCG